MTYVREAGNGSESVSAALVRTGKYGVADWLYWDMRLVVGLALWCDMFPSPEGEGAGHKVQISLSH